MTLHFKTRCGCEKEIKITGGFNPPSIYLLPLMLKVSDRYASVSKYNDPLALPPGVETRRFKLIRTTPKHDLYFDAYYEED